MSPKEAKIFFVEDEPAVREYAIELLESGGHSVVLEAGDRATALELVKRAKDMGIDVAVVDGNLSGRRIDCSDGREIAAALRREIPSIKVVAFSTNLESSDYGDVKVDKRDFDNWVTTLAEIVNSL